MNLTVANESELPAVVKSIWPIVSKQPIVLFRGDLGAGKTTIIKEIGRYLGVTSDMSSPSFGIVNEYKVDNKVIYHIDLYRIEELEEIYEFGLPEILESGNICLIEWPEMAEEIWQDYDCSEVHLSIENSTSRRIFVK